jgi:dTDP-4-amino-4,6-dideoxygalactose transaminase
MLPNNISASIGLAQLKKIDRLQKKREQIWNFYNSEFKKNINIKTPINADKDSKHSFFTYCVRVKR